LFVRTTSAPFIKPDYSGDKNIVFPTAGCDPYACSVRFRSDPAPHNFSQPMQFAVPISYSGKLCGFAVRTDASAGTTFPQTHVALQPRSSRDARRCESGRGTLKEKQNG